MTSQSAYDMHTNLGHMNQNIYPVGLVVPTPIWNRIDLMDDSIETIWCSASLAWRQMIPSGMCVTKRYPNKTNPLQLQAVNRVAGLVQHCSISSALAMEMVQSCTKLSMWYMGPKCMIHVCGTESDSQLTYQQYSNDNNGMVSIVSALPLCPRT